MSPVTPLKGFRRVFIVFSSGHVLAITYAGVCGTCRYFFAGLFPTICSQEANNLPIQ
jgi:hypothetical protein